MRFRRTTSRPRAFTAMELMLGMLVTALVMAAVSALMTAVGRGWMYNDSTQASSNTIVQSHQRFLRTLKAARQIGTTRQGSIDGAAAQTAAVMLWKGDANLDSQIQFSELAMIEHDNGDDTLVLYDVHFPADWTTEQKAAADTPALDDDDIYEPNVIETFKGMANVVATVIVRNVVGAEFHRVDSESTVRPMLEYVVRVDRGSTTETEYGSVALRVPATMPVSQR